MYVGSDVQLQDYVQLSIQSPHVHQIDHHTPGGNRKAIRYGHSTRGTIEMLHAPTAPYRTSNAQVASVRGSITIQLCLGDLGGGATVSHAAGAAVQVLVWWCC
jgi:hypothetical protein